jgi:hypothetical protein
VPVPTFALSQGQGLRLAVKKKPAAKKEQAHYQHCCSSPSDTHVNSVLAYSHTPTYPQEHAWFVVAPKAGRKKKTEQVRPDAAPIPLPHLTLPMSAHLLSHVEVSRPHLVACRAPVCIC